MWVRGYGLVDSPKVQAGPGKILNLTAVAAPNARAAAEYYPASYWYSLAKVPDKSEFPGTGPNGNGIPEEMRSQADWLNQMRCGACHQIGTKATREIPKSLGTFDSSAGSLGTAPEVGTDGRQAWPPRSRQFGPRGMAMYADWTDRIAAGEVPEAPPRPQGVERNVVVTLWDWSTTEGFVHDTISTDKRNPTSTPTVPSTAFRGSARPMSTSSTRCATRQRVWRCRFATRTRRTPTPQKSLEPSPYWGEEIIWSGQASLHNPMLDRHRAGLAHACDSCGRQSGVLQTGIEPSIRPAVPAQHQRPPSLRDRSEDQAGRR